MPEFDYDLFTLGAGSGGVRASRVAGGLGARVAIAEHSDLGGTCVNVGCIPKKLLVYGAHFRQDFEDARAYGWDAHVPSFDWQALIKAKDDEIHRLNGIYERLLSNAGVDIIQGRARLVDPHTVEVDGKRFTAKNILVAVGGWPWMPSFPGVEHCGTSNEMFSLPELPKRIVVAGAGYIALEFACIFRGLGSEVAVVHRRALPLRGFDDDIRQCVHDSLEEKDIRLCMERTIAEVRRRESGELEIQLDQGEVIEADACLMALGRQPRTESLGLQEAGVELNDSGAIVVDSDYRTSVPHIYAVGDVTDRVNLTPVALGEGMIVAHRLFGKGRGPLNYDNIPTAVFTIPPVATVGKTEHDARRDGPVDVYISRFRPLKHTLTKRSEQIMMKLIVSQKDDRIVGCHMVGDDTPEIVQAVAVAINCGATKEQFDATVGLHPSAAEELVTMREKRSEIEPAPL